MSSTPSYAGAAKLIGGQVAAKKAKPKKTFVDWIKARLVFMLLGGVAFFGWQTFGPAAQHAAVAEHVPHSARPGQCFRADATKLAVPCTQTHTYEVFGAAVFADRAPHPGAAAGIVGNPVCEQEFARVTGGASTGRYEHVPVNPTTDEWDLGRREVACVLFLADDSTKSSSVSR